MDLFCSGIALMAVGSNVPNIVLYLLIVTSSVVLAYYIFLKARHNYFYCSYSTVYIVPFIVPLYTVVCTLRALLNSSLHHIAFPSVHGSCSDFISNCYH